MTTKLLTQWSLSVALLVIGSAATADIAFIVNTKSSVTTLSADQVKNMYLGKAKTFADGSPVEPIDQAKGAPARDELYRNYVKKDEATLQAYWSKQIFSGNGGPPRVLENAANVKAWVAKNPSAIGYVEATEVDSSVKRITVQ